LLQTSSHRYVHATRSPIARHKARLFSPARAWHGPVVSGPGMAQPGTKRKAQWRPIRLVTPKIWDLAQPTIHIYNLPLSIPNPNFSLPLPTRLSRIDDGHLRSPLRVVSHNFFPPPWLCSAHLPRCRSPCLLPRGASPCSCRGRAVAAPLHASISLARGR
jgi:hypothetical protein